MNAAEKQLHKQLAMMVEAAANGLQRDGYAYKCPADFVLQHGVWYEPRVLPKKIPRGAPKVCYANAIVACIRDGWTYVEGWAMNPWGIPIEHAWNVHKGRMYDVTWPSPGLAYLGVEFSVGRADDATWNGEASVIDDYRRRWPLLKDPWTGEDFQRVWEPTEALKVAMLMNDPRVTTAQKRKALEAIRS